ncbi:hypothetical protein FA13DRAFT_1779140 [Coprinellus micaceus]|uniref:Uncharacterized protein n=1 Tax=Coprinellus micaceus TaxID=71717 RepID=A0A4Y7SIX3_COPMI|nr:hypothetical protein FA13DRAFT_1779140 [Coprinellus micaceus]
MVRPNWDEVAQSGEDGKTRLDLERTAVHDYLSVHLRPKDSSGALSLTVGRNGIYEYQHLPNRGDVRFHGAALRRDVRWGFSAPGFVRVPCSRRVTLITMHLPGITSSPRVCQSLPLSGKPKPHRLPVDGTPILELRGLASRSAVPTQLSLPSTPDLQVQRYKGGELHGELTSVSSPLEFVSFRDRRGGAGR